ncbi:MAG: hypothetical protein MN733_44250 [Nitrososphaera sp.]|nr:hypothetical protein [Nitrososphaera sp.]
MKLEQKQKSNSPKTGFLDAAVLISGLAIYGLCANPPEAQKPQMEIITETRTVRDGDTLYPFLFHEVHPIDLIHVGLSDGSSFYEASGSPPSMTIMFGQEISVPVYGRIVTIRAEMGYEPETAVITLSETVNPKR